jgi:hypothetical protein
MKYAIIPPRINIDLSSQGDILFCLGQQYVRDSNYREFFLQKRKEGWHIILDNGVGDHGDIINPQTLLEITEELLPTEVIALDVLFDARATIENYIEFERSWLQKKLFEKGVALFFCPQGQNLADWLKAYKFALNRETVSVIGFSKLAIPHVLGGINEDQGIMEARHNMYDILSVLNLLKKPIHCLGAGDPREFRYYKNPIMRSTDSCFSVWAGMNNVDWSDGDYTRFPTPKDFFDRKISSDQERELILRNIAFLKNDCV